MAYLGPGSEFPVEVAITQIAIGGPPLFTAYLRDITERKRTEQGLQFLAEASVTLATLVDYQTTLQKIAGLAVPQFADWCVVDIVESDRRKDLDDPAEHLLNCAM